MAEDLLSQTEIDALFAQMAQAEDIGTAPEQDRFRSVRPYDFRHPSKFSKDQLRTLQMIFEGLARVASTHLSGVLRSQVHMTLVSVEQTVFDRYVQALPARTLLTLASVDPLPGSIVFQYDMVTAYVIVDRLLGGSGLTLHVDREVSEIEEALWQSISTVFLDALSESWAHIVQLAPKLQRLEYSPRFLQIASRNEPIVLMLFDLRIGDQQTTLSLCIPYSVIEPIAADLNIQTFFKAAQGGATDEGTDELHRRLQQVSIPVVALLGTTELPLSALGDLRVNDIIRLDGAAGDPLVVMVNHKPTHMARAGLLRQTMGIQIVDVLPEEDV